MTVCYWCGAKDTLADIGKELDDGKYKMVQCSKCKNAYYVVNKEKMNKQKPMTNEEWLRKASTEELEKLFEKAQDYGATCANGDKEKCLYCGCPWCEMGFAKWLKEKHE